MKRLLLIVCFILIGDSSQAYEFAVRLEDKTNSSVICENPTHEEEVSFQDSTFELPCPECNDSKWLERTNDKVPKKGHFITFKPDGWSWGRNERKHYGIVRIECTEEQAALWCSRDSEFRKPKFDFEKSLTSTQLDNWKNKEVFSSVVDADSVYVKTSDEEI